MAYLGARPSSVTVEQCRKAVAATFPETGEMNMERWTEQLVAERKEEWLQEGILVGMQKGIQEGMQKGMKEGMQTGIKEGMQKGMKEGMQTGIKEGMQTGIKEGMTSFTIRLLLRKFQSLDSELENRVRRLSREELEALGDDLLDIPNEEALTEWLDRRTKTH
jgi:flagellar biosynthesis/type III secretory pathway protein FliH